MTNGISMLDELEEMVSYRGNVTGVTHTIFIASRGNARHTLRLKVAIEPPDSLNPHTEIAVIKFDGSVVAGTIEPALLAQVRQFIKRNRTVLLDYWHYKIDTDQLRRRLKRVPHICAG